MAKSTVGGGASATEHEMSDGGPIVIRRAEIGFVDRPDVEEEEDQSPDNQGDGTDSSPSSASALPPNESNTPSSPKPAHTTESPSDQQEQETDSSAPTTDGSGQTTPRKPSSKTATKRPVPTPPARSAARVRSTDDEFDDEF